ncbi:MAG: GntR family transcriptional regulator [Comamonas sp.]
MESAPPAAARAPQEKRYLQLAGLFRHKIVSGQWPVGSSIPTVQQLEALHHASRTTVRMALGSLVSEGLVKTRKRGGTQVMAAPARPPSFSLPSSWKELVAFHGNTDYRLLESEPGCLPVIPAGMDFEGELASVYQRLLGLHCCGDQPFCLSQMYVEQSLFDRIAPQLPQLSVVEALTRGPRPLATARQRLGIAPADELIQTHLGVALGTPLLQTLRWACDRKGRMVHWAQLGYLGEYAHIEMDLLA